MSTQNQQSGITGATVLPLPTVLTYNNDYYELPIRVSRLTSKIPSTGATTYTVTTSSPQLNFIIPNESRSAGHMALSVNAQVNFTGGATGHPVSFPYNMSGIVSQLRILFNTTEVYNCQKWNLLQNIYNDSVQNDLYNRFSGYQMQGNVPFRQDQTLGGITVSGRCSIGATATDYLIPLDTEFLHRILPSVQGLVPNSTITVQIYLAPAADILEYDNLTGSVTTYSYTINNPTLIVEQIVEPVEFIDKLKADMKAQKFIAIPYKKRAQQDFIVASGTAGNFNINISDKVSSLTSILMTFRNNTSGRLTDPTYFNRLGCWDTGNINYYSFKANGIVVPQQTISASGSGAETLKEYLLAFSQWYPYESVASTSFGYNKSGGLRFGNVWSIGTTPAQYSENDYCKRLYSYNFLVPVLNDKYDLDDGRASVVNTGLNLSQSSSGLQVYFNKSTDSITWLIDAFTISDALLIITENGSIYVEN